MIAHVSTNEEMKELRFIFNVASAGFRSLQLGKDACERMKKGDFTNTPEIKKEIIKKIVKGYD